MDKYIFDKRVMKKKAIKYAICFAIIFPVVYAVNQLTKGAQNQGLAFLLQVLTGIVALIVCEWVIYLYNKKKTQTSKKDVVVIKKNVISNKKVKYELQQQPESDKTDSNKTSSDNDSE